LGKKLKNGFEPDQPDVGKCCHTVRHTLAHFLIIIQFIQVYTDVPGGAKKSTTV
jgi:hypothetical protein